MDTWKQLLRPHCSIFEYMWALKRCQLYLSVLFLLFFSTGAMAQTKVLRGVILDVQSGERIPFASMKLDKSGFGKLSDSAGGFIFHFDQWPRDTLQITYVGYQTYITGHRRFANPSCYPRQPLYYDPPAAWSIY